MKKFLVSVGLAAAGTASLYAYGFQQDQSKVWSVSATLRGFYDDNYTTAHSQKQDSFGFEVSPTIEVHAPLQQTEIGARYVYGLYYYEARENNHQNPIDQTHEFDLWLDHAFTPRWETRLSDSFRVAQEPELVGGGAVERRVKGNNIANTANLSLHTVWTPEVSTDLGYENSYYRYDNRGAAFLATIPPTVIPSLAGLLDRVDQSITPEFQWTFTRETMAVVGYKFEIVNFTANEATSYNPNTGGYYYSNSRDNYSHFGYVGIQHKFLENLSGSARAGVQYTKYYNDPAATSSFGPYADVSLIYTYASGSYAQIGFTQSRNATDQIQVDSAGHITQDQESSVVYASINHPLTAKLMGSLVGHYQHSIYNQGQYNNQTSDFYNLGVNLTYTFTRHLSSEVGYNFDYYTSDIPGLSYTRNRVYLGVSATY